MLLGAARRRVNARQEEERRRVNEWQEEDYTSDEEEEDPAQYFEHVAPFYQRDIDIAGETERLRGNYVCPHYWQFMGFGGHWQCFDCGTWNNFRFVSLDPRLYTVEHIA